MIRGTTPTLRFELPFQAEAIAALSIAFKQKDVLRVEKTLNDVKCEGNIISCKLEQKDTLALDDQFKIDIQLRIRTVHGDAIASNIIKTSIGRLLRDGEI